MQYLVSFLVLQSSHWGRERWLLKNCFKCHVTVSALCLFLAVQCVGLQCVIVVFPSHTPMIKNCFPAPIKHICVVIVRNKLITYVCILSAGLSVHFYRYR